VNAIDALHSEQQEIKDRHEKEKADLLVRYADIKLSESHRQQHENKIEQLCQDMNTDFEKQYKDQQQAVKERLHISVKS
jgi:oligoendopeptidase F